MRRTLERAAVHTDAGTSCATAGMAGQIQRGTRQAVTLSPMNQVASTGQRPPAESARCVGRPARQRRITSLRGRHPGVAPNGVPPVRQRDHSPRSADVMDRTAAQHDGAIRKPSRSAFLSRGLSMAERAPSGAGGRSDLHNRTAWHQGRYGSTVAFAAASESAARGCPAKPSALAERTMIHRSRRSASSQRVPTREGNARASLLAMRR